MKHSGAPPADKGREGTSIHGCHESGPLPFRDTEVAFRARADAPLLKLTPSALPVPASCAFTVLRGLEEKSPRWVRSWREEQGSCLQYSCC